VELSTPIHFRFNLHPCGPFHLYPSYIAKGWSFLYILLLYTYHKGPIYTLPAKAPNRDASICTTVIKTKEPTVPQGPSSLSTKPFRTLVGSKLTGPIKRSESVSRGCESQWRRHRSHWLHRTEAVRPPQTLSIESTEWMKVGATELDRRSSPLPPVPVWPDSGECHVRNSKTRDGGRVAAFGWCREASGRADPKLQALVYDSLPSATAVFSYATGPRKLSANEQFFLLVLKQ